MTIQIMKSREARTKWRHLLDTVLTGKDVMIERNGQPVAVLIPVKDYDGIRTDLEELRATQHAAAAYTDWQQNPEMGRSWEVVRAELVAEGKLDE